MRLAAALATMTLGLTAFATGCAAEGGSPAPAPDESIVTSSAALTAHAVRVDAKVSEVYVTVQKSGAWVLTARCDAEAKTITLEHKDGSVTQPFDAKACSPRGLASGALAIGPAFAARIAPGEFPQDKAGCDVVGAQSWTQVASDDGWFTFGVTAAESRSCCFAHDSCMLVNDCSGMNSLSGWSSLSCAGCHTSAVGCFALAAAD